MEFINLKIMRKNNIKLDAAYLMMEKTHLC